MFDAVVMGEGRVCSGVRLSPLCKGGCVVESREAFEMFRGVATCGEIGMVQGLR